MTVANAKPDLLITGPLGTTTVNAASSLWSAYTGVEAKITAAIAYAVSIGAKAVYVPDCFLPYTASLVTFNTAVKLIREGGNPAWYDVQAYGTGVGNPSDTPAIQAAVNAANAAGGGVVYFPPAQYHISTSIDLSNMVSITLLGAGRNATLLALETAVPVINIVLGTRITIRDMWIGSFAAQGSGGGGIRSINPGFPLTPTSDLTIEHVTFQNLPAPINFDNVGVYCRDVQFTQTIAGATLSHVIYLIRCQSCVFDNVRLFITTGTLPGDAMRIDSDCDTILCWKCEHVLLGNGASTAAFHVMDSVGAGTNPPRIIRLTDCTGENANLGFLIDAGRDVTIVGSETANNTTHGVSITGGNSIKVTQGQHFLNKQHGIAVSGGVGILLDGNTCSNNSQLTNNTYDGINIAGTVTGGCRIVNNRCGDIFFTLTNKQRSGLNLMAGSDFLFVSGNDLQGNLGPGFSVPINNASVGANNQFAGSGFFPISEGVLVAGLDTQCTQPVAITVTLTAARVVGALINVFKGQRATFTFIQDGTGGRAVTWNAVYKTSWADAGNTLNKRSSISYVYDGTNWNQDGAQTPYV